MTGDLTIKRITEALASNLKKELRDQGHYLTGALEASITVKKAGSGNSTTFEMEALEYADDLFEGVPPEHIDELKHITTMIEYAKKRFGLSGKAANKAGAAIARAHMKGGIPTKGSYEYSKTGERLFANLEAFNKNEDIYTRMLEQGASTEIDATINKMFDQTIF